MVNIRQTRVKKDLGKNYSTDHLSNYLCCKKMDTKLQFPARF